MDQTVPESLEKRTVTVVGSVVGLPVTSMRSTRFDFRVESATYKGQPVRLPTLVRLSAYKGKKGKAWQPPTGSRWQLRVRLKNPHGFQNPGGFDYESHLFANRIRATGYVYRKSEPKRLRQPSWSFSFDRLREKIRQRLDAILGSHSQLPVITALTIGDRQGLDQSAWGLLQRTGTSHLVAISGLHLSIVSGLVFFLVKAGWGFFEYGTKRFAAQKAGAVAGILSAYAYAGLAGFSIPTQRALIMLVVVYGALLLSRQAIRTQVMATALLAVLVYDPLSILGPGFWLSFAAVFIILFVSTGIGSTRRWYQGIRTQAAISLGLIPVTLLFFQSASLVSPIANLFAIPVYGLLVVPLSLASLVTPEIISHFLVSTAASISEIAWSSLSLLDTNVPLHLSFASPGLLAMTCAILGLLIMAMPLHIGLRLSAGIWLLPLLWVPAPPERGEFRATLLDVGQGLSLVVRTSNHVMVYDTGARFSDRFNAGTAVVVPFLRQQGIDKIDSLVISHGDNDHIGGMQPLRQEIEVREVISNAPRANANEPCIKGKRWNWDGVEFSILHPERNDQTRRNNGSCVMRIEGPANSLLVTGDIEKQAEKLLVKRYGSGLRSNVLIAPHHGSRTSSTREFLQTVQPEWILVPAGHLNRYRHPSVVVTERYRLLGIPWLVSGENGAIEINSVDMKGVPKTYRQQYRRYWHGEQHHR